MCRDFAITDGYDATTSKSPSGTTTNSASGTTTNSTSGTTTISFGTTTADFGSHTPIDNDRVIVSNHNITGLQVAAAGGSEHERCDQSYELSNDGRVALKRSHDQI